MLKPIPNKSKNASYIMILDKEDEGAIPLSGLSYHPKTGVIKRVKSKSIYIHRQILKAPYGLIVDHINGNNLDNRRSNLRVCSKYQNHKNQGKPKNNTSGFIGVCLDPRMGLKKRWYAQIKVNRKHIKIGYFETAEKAARVRDEYAIKHFGEFARLNFPKG